MTLVADRTWAPLEGASDEQREQDLVARHRYGDPAAFEELYGQYAAMVYNMSLRSSGDPVLAEDLSQEVFLRIYRSLARFRGNSSLKTWIYRVCINHCRSRLGRRARLRKVEVPEASLEHALADSAPGPEETAVQGDERRLLRTALPRIDAVFRESVILRDIEGLSYSEIAEVLGVPVGTVRSRIARGRDQLRALLEVSR
jgi:RNA polymerase sigma-70 factor (ECF subfamily)